MHELGPHDKVARENERERGERDSVVSFLFLFMWHSREAVPIFWLFCPMSQRQSLTQRRPDNSPCCCKQTNKQTNKQKHHVMIKVLCCWSKPKEGEEGFKSGGVIPVCVTIKSSDASHLLGWYMPELKEAIIWTTCNSVASQASKQLTLYYLIWMACTAHINRSRVKPIFSS